MISDETVFVRTRSKCAECPLRDRTRVWGRGTTRSRVAFFGEAPGETEDNLGIPFVGLAGKQFDRALYAAAVPRADAWISNILPCRPPGNNIDSFEAIEAMECCRPGLEQELTFLAGEGISVLVPLGNHSKCVLAPEADAGIMRVRGSVYSDGDFAILPTIHPSFFARTGGYYKKQESTVSMRLIWYEDFRKALRIARVGFSLPEEAFLLYPQVEDVEEFFQTDGPLAVDIETAGGFTPDKCDIFMIGFAADSSRALCVPFFKQGYLPYWHNGELREVRALLNQAFREHDLLFQNALFDVPILQYKGFTVPWSRVKHDTMLLHHSLNPELPHDIGFITSLYGMTPYWKDKRIGRISEMADDEARTYNLRDCVVLHQITPPMLEDLDAYGDGPISVYTNEAMKLIKPVGKMHLNGVYLDQSRLDKFIEEKRTELQNLEKDLKRIASLPECFNLSSDDELRWFFFEVPPGKFKKIDELPGKKRKDTKVYRQLLDLQTIRDTVRPLYVLPNPGKRPKTESGSLSVDDGARLSYRIKLQNELSLLEKRKIVTDQVRADKRALQRLLDWLAKFEEYKTLSKVLSTYAKFPVWSDGRMHSRFNIHGTATGRLSSRDPNLQNIPKKLKGIRRCMTAEKGHLIVSGDYSNLEVRVLAEIVDDPVLRREVAGNVHDENTRILFGLEKTDKDWGLARRAAKIFFFGTIAYGGGPRKVYEEVVLEVPELNLTYESYTKARNAWFAAHPAYSTWRSAIEADTSRIATTFGGRIRQLNGPKRDIFKEKLNTPVQGGAAHIINRAMITLEEIIESSFPGVRTILQIHDQLVYEVPEESLHEFVPRLRGVMEWEVPIHGRLVSFPVDIEIGPNLEELVPYENPATL